jgi:hypothetical protein
MRLMSTGPDPSPMRKAPEATLGVGDTDHEAKQIPVRLGLPATRVLPDVAKPEYYPPASYSADDPTGCLKSTLFVVVSYFVLKAILRHTSHTGSQFDGIVCYATLAFVLLLSLVGARDWYRKIATRDAERRRWAAGCRSAQLMIVGRHEASSWWDECAQRYQRSHNRVDLQMNFDQKAVSPGMTVVGAEVDHRVFERLKERSSVSVYYMPEAPTTFLLEEEL